MVIISPSECNTPVLYMARKREGSDGVTRACACACVCERDGRGGGWGGGRPFIFCATCSTLDKCQRVIVLWVKNSHSPLWLWITCAIPPKGRRAISRLQLTDDDVHPKHPCHRCTTRQPPRVHVRDKRYLYLINSEFCGDWEKSCWQSELGSI